ncbi:peptidoglycan-binding domain-containing protein [Pantanalinema rosaneae CENA516]|uniref:peptidoglycan-binding domain-containing protein n=1 Tax=Pantanalinema rosaneae TaxID=1620701 RepID=UPI003D6E15D2
MVTTTPSHLAQELSLGTEIHQNQAGKQVKRVQEWLTFHNFATAIDSEFGPATERCVKNFQAARDLPVTGIVDQATYTKLVEPLAKVLKEISPSPGETLGSMVLKYAKQHLTQHPIELGGQNRGPWVRLYMDGNEGTEWAWCAGFVTFILKQACTALNHPMPIPGSFGCDVLAKQARQSQRRISDSSIIHHSVSWSTLEPCCIFLVRRASDDWTHTGFAFGRDGDTFVTIEGNTNDEGSAEGYEVCTRVRSIRDKDFIRLS